MGRAGLRVAMLAAARGMVVGCMVGDGNTVAVGRIVAVGDGVTVGRAVGVGSDVAVGAGCNRCTASVNCAKAVGS